jgi:hypothetical protein
MGDGPRILLSHDHIDPNLGGYRLCRWPQGGLDVNAIIDTGE